MSERIRGVVKFYNSQKDFGFIERLDGGEDVHFDKSSCLEKVPQENDNIDFEVEDTNRRPHAINLKIVENETVEFLKENVLNLKETDYDKFCDNVKEYAFNLRDGDLTTSKIRKIYARIMNTKNIAELKMLRPQFAYTAGRDNSQGVQSFMDLLDFLVKKMDNKSEEELANFKTFMESVIAYRKYAGDDK